MKKLSTQQYIDLCRVAAQEDRKNKYNSQMLFRIDPFKFQSKSFVQISNKSIKDDQLGRKVIKFNSIKEEIEDSIKILNLIHLSTEQIEKGYGHFVLETYLKLDRKANKKYAKQIAEEYGYDHRIFKKQMDLEIEKALNKPKMISYLESIKTLALKHDKQEYLKIFED